MEALYGIFTTIPIASVKLLGLVYLIAITGIVIFKIVLTKPKK